MKIAQLAQLWCGIPPYKYGGASYIVSNITEELIKRGHKVTIFAPGNTITKARLEAIVPKPTLELGIDWSDLDFELLNISNCYSKAENFDIIHGHISASDAAILIAQPKNTPCVFTIHNSFFKHKKSIQEIINQRIKKVNFISISKSFQRKTPGLKYIANIYNGIDVEKYTFNNSPRDYLAWLGRFDPTKGVKEAILVAKKLHKRLIIAGRMNKEEEVYFNREIKKYIDNDQIKFLGEISFQDKNKLLANAYATLVPTSWNEPFGLVTAEAAACGSPVVGFKVGATPEIVKNGVTGFVVPKGNIKKMVEAVKNIDQINREDCRNYVAQNFSIKKMVDRYERVYSKLINKGR